MVIGDLQVIVMATVMATIMVTIMAIIMDIQQDMQEVDMIQTIFIGTIMETPKMVYRPEGKVYQTKMQYHQGLINLAMPVVEETISMPINLGMSINVIPMVNGRKNEITQTLNKGLIARKHQEQIVIRQKEQNVAKRPMLGAIHSEVNSKGITVIEVEAITIQEITAIIGQVVVHDKQCLDEGDKQLYIKNPQ